MADLVTALGLVLVLEGAIYALAPGGMKRAMAALQSIPEESLRRGGVVALVLGVGLVWLIRG